MLESGCAAEAQQRCELAISICSLSLITPMLNRSVWGGEVNAGDYLDFQAPRDP